jgi:hypothetical protein
VDVIPSPWLFGLKQIIPKEIDRLLPQRVVPWDEFPSISYEEEYGKDLEVERRKISSLKPLHVTANGLQSWIVSYESEYLVVIR